MTVPAQAGSHTAPASPFHQPRAVWAVAFAGVISSMGIGLVDPILPALSKQQHATPSQVSLLSTCCLSVIVASSSGGFAGAIVLYGTAIGPGIAVGPRLGADHGARADVGPAGGAAPAGRPDARADLGRMRELATT